MSGLLGLGYSDDEADEEQTLQPLKLTQPAAAAPAVVAAASGLVAYEDSDEDEEAPAQRAASSSQQHVAAASSTAATVAAAAPAPTVSLGANAGAARLAPLRPSASAQSSLAEMKVTAAAAVRRSASSDDIAAPSDERSTRDPRDDPTSSDANAALHAKVESLLPPGDPALLSEGLAVRHRENLARAAALRARAASTGQHVPSLVQSLHANQAFHNPYILSRIAAQMQLSNLGYGSNLPSSLWREQNLQTDGSSNAKEEDDYLAIRKQAEEAYAAARVGRTAIDFVPAASAGAPAPAAASAAAVGGLQQLSSHVVATVNPDGSITRVRVFDDASGAAAASASAPVANNSATAPASIDTAAARPRKSKWDQSTVAPTAAATSTVSAKRTAGASDATAADSKRARQ